MLALSLLLNAAVAAAAVAQPGPADPNPADVRAGAYKVDPNHTQVTFGVSHMGFAQYRGRFSGVEGVLRIDPRRVAVTQLEVTIPTASVSTTSDKLDGELKSPQWLDAGRFPQMRFRSTRVTPTGPGRARVEGELTLHGVTRPVTLQARFVGAGIDPIDKAYTVGFEATGELSRSAFGVKTYAPLIGDAVTLTLAGAFEAAP
ncbi:MAG: YceI family protein [Caulobacteraceae bacterium]|nr:YceI family protein [Caulobacter sp.]